MRVRRLAAKKHKSPNYLRTLGEIIITLAQLSSLAVDMGL